MRVMTDEELRAAVRRAVGMVGSVSRAEFARKLRAMAELIDDGATADAVRDVYSYWVARMKKNPKTTKLTADRRAKVSARLREGATVAEIKTAIDGVAESEWHSGANESGRRYQDLTLICQSRSKLEQFRDMADSRSNVVRLPKSRDRVSW